jgi:hypothetical protein
MEMNNFGNRNFTQPIEMKGTLGCGLCKIVVGNPKP